MRAQGWFSFIAAAAFAVVAVAVQTNRLHDVETENAWLQNELSEATKRGNAAWVRCSVRVDGGVTMSYYWKPTPESCPDPSMFWVWPAPKGSK